MLSVSKKKNNKSRDTFLEQMQHKNKNLSKQAKILSNINVESHICNHAEKVIVSHLKFSLFASSKRK